MCFSPQRRAISQHLNFKKWSETVSFLAFWLQNVLLATAACNFSTSQLQKVVWACQFFSILTSKCASRHSGVQFFNISTSKSGLSMSVLLATAACNFSTSQLQKVVRSWCVLYIFTSKCASRHSGVQFLISALTTWLRTRRFNEPTFRLTRHTNHWKTQRFATSLTFGAHASCFFWLSRYCIFFLLTLLHLLTLLSCDFTSSICFSSAFQLSILSEVYYLNFLR